MEGVLTEVEAVDVVHEGELEPPSEEGLEGLLRSRGASESKSGVSSGFLNGSASPTHHNQ